MLYLHSDEYENLRGPFQCVIVDNIFIYRRQALIVSIEPVLAGVDYGKGLSPIKYLILLAKYSDKNLKNLRLPIDVIVFLPENLENPLEDLKAWTQMHSIGWAELCDYR